MNGRLACLSLNSAVPEISPAGKTIVLEGSVIGTSFHFENCGIIEPPSTSPLPGGLLVSQCLLTLPAKPGRLPDVLTNESEHDITIPPKTVLAELNSIQCVIPNEKVNADS